MNKKITNIEPPEGYTEKLIDCAGNKYFMLNSDEVRSLVREFSHSFINVNENPLASEVMMRMIKFVEEK